MPLRAVFVEALSRVPPFAASRTVARRAPLAEGFPARTLARVATSSCRGSSSPGDGTCVSCLGRRALYAEPQGSPSALHGRHSKTSESEIVSL